MIKDYFWHYIAYEDLKDALKTDYVTEPTPANPKPDRKPWTEADERRFVALLESELDKVASFQALKSKEIIQRIKASEQEVNHVVSRLESSASDPRHAAERPTDEDFLLLEADLSDIIADVHDLAKFTQLNYTGFQKIIKKHDVGLIWNPAYNCGADKSHYTETNKVVSEACLCCPIECQAILQG